MHVEIAEQDLLRSRDTDLESGLPSRISFEIEHSLTNGSRLRQSRVLGIRKSAASGCVGNRISDRADGHDEKDDIAKHESPPGPDRREARDLLGRRF